MIEVRPSHNLWVWTAPAYGYLPPEDERLCTTADEALREAWAYAGPNVPALVFPRGAK
jgi:hypothetical protein